MSNLCIFIVVARAFGVIAMGYLYLKGGQRKRSE